MLPSSQNASVTGTSNASRSTKKRTFTFGEETDDDNDDDESTVPIFYQTDDEDEDEDEDDDEETHPYSLSSTGRSYIPPLINVQSKIVMETMSKNQTLCVIGITWSVFIAAASVLIIPTFVGSDFVELDFPSCENGTFPTISCLDVETNGTFFWNFKANISVEEMDNLAGFIALRVLLLDSLEGSPTNAIMSALSYDLEVTGCTHDNGCDDDEFLDVLLYGGRSVEVAELDDANNQKGRAENATQEIEFFNVFQNQESLTGVGSITEYHIEIDLHGSESSGALLLQNNIAGIFFEFETYSLHLLVRATAAFLVILLVFAIIWLSIMFRVEAVFSTWLTERKWLVLLLVGIACVVNIFLVLESLLNTKHPWLIFTAKLFQHVGVGIIAYTFLLFSDRSHRLVGKGKGEMRRIFYLPKLAPVVLNLTSQIGIDAIIFPSVSGADRTEISSAYIWNPQEQKLYVTFCCLYYFSILLWMVMMVYFCITNGRRLLKLRYLETRFAQLSFRFYLLQMSLYAILEVINLCILLHKVITYAVGREVSLADFTNKLNSLFAPSDALFARLLLISVMTVVVMYIYLPPKYAAGMKGTPQALWMQLYEDNIPLCSPSFMARNTKRPFVAETALKLAELSWEAYADPPGHVSQSNNKRNLNLERLGFEIMDWIYDKEHEVNCLVARDTTRKELAVVFRGTNSKQQWFTNFKFTALPFNFDEICAVDADSEVPLSIVSRDDINEFEKSRLFKESLFADSETSEEEKREEKKFSLRFSPRISPRISPRAWFNSKVLHKERSINLPAKKKETSRQSSTDKRDSSEKEKQRRPRISPMPSFKRVSSVCSSPMASFKRLSFTEVQEQILDEMEHGLRNSMLKDSTLVNGIITRVHRGFWHAYESIRVRLHASVRKAVLECPTSTLYVTGHSLGGSLATFAALDLTKYTLPKINDHFQQYPRYEEPRIERHGNINSAVRVHSIALTLYTFGMPRTVNKRFATKFNNLVPNAYRVSNDGDIVTGLPPTWTFLYKHIGEKIIVDPRGSGKYLINPSFVENRFSRRSKTRVQAHMPSSYEDSLLGIFQAEEGLGERWEQIRNQYQRQIDSPSNSIREVGASLIGDIKLPSGHNVSASPSPVLEEGKEFGMEGKMENMKPTMKKMFLNGERDP